jgi:hypothetical protein
VFYIINITKSIKQATFYYENEVFIINYMIMKKILFYSLLALLFYSCGTQKKITNNPDSRMILLINDTFTKHQLDSLCVADTISSDLNTWIIGTFVDYETNTPVKEYSYIKIMKEDEILYRVIEEGIDYKITKRLTDN